jgi:hypothetical protein
MDDPMESEKYVKQEFPQSYEVSNIIFKNETHVEN